MGWFDIAAGALEDIGIGDGVTGGNAVTDAVAAAGGGSSSWWEKGITQMMPSIMGAAMRPKAQQHATAAPSGHGVQVNTSGMMKPFDEVRSMADDNPLSGIHQWSNLFG